MIDVHQACEEAILQAARQMCNAAQTAPKACGRDDIVSGILTGGEIQALGAEMRRIEAETPNCKPIFVRDAELVEKSTAVVLIGVRHQPRGLAPCGICGHGDCGGCKKAGGHCAYDDMDLGIALGSAASLAADLRVDNRILYTGGMAAMGLKLLGEDVGTIMAIPLAVSARNIFFTRTITVPADGCK